MAASTKIGRIFSPRVFCPHLGLSSILGRTSRISQHESSVTSKRHFGQPVAQTHPHLVQQGEVTPGLTAEEFRNRRQNLMNRIATTHLANQTHNHIVIVPSAPRVYMTNDIPYVFRQNTDFLYLCGFQEPNSLLILESDDSVPLPDHKTTLFVPKRDLKKELWEGARSGIEGAMELAGVDAAFNMEDLDKYLSRYVRDHRSYTIWYDYRKPAHIEFHLKHIQDFMKENKYGSVESPKGIIQMLRAVKSPAELELMQKTCETGCRALKEVMMFSYPGVNEGHLNAKMEFECRLAGAEYLAYPPVVAGGNRANTIHYVSNNQLVQDGELVLMDAGCEQHGYSSDITRTWPVSGSFSTAQRELYEAVLEVQEACIDMCHTDLSLEIIFHEMLILVGKQLQRLHIAPHHLQGLELQRYAREFCPHHVGHYLGMDVHDTDEVSRSIKVQPGMVVTIEPGIYIRDDDGTAPSEFRGTGIRIEDDVSVTEDSPNILTSTCPKLPNDIEYLLSHR